MSRPDAQARADALRGRLAAGEDVPAFQCSPETYSPTCRWCGAEVLADSILYCSDDCFEAAQQGRVTQR